MARFGSDLNNSTLGEACRIVRVGRFYETMGYEFRSTEGPSPTDGSEIVDQVKEIRTLVKQLVHAADIVESTVDVAAKGVRPLLRLRERRKLYFGNSLFGEPAWEILLELYDAQSRGRGESVTSLCVASGVPTTTAIRWIGTLESRGWLIRKPDPRDRRRLLVEATDKTIDAMNRLFAKGNPLNI